jgi:hypothetical protein
MSVALKEKKTRFSSLPLQILRKYFATLVQPYNIPEDWFSRISYF